GGQAVSGPASALGVGSHTIKAVYSGDNNFIASSAALAQTVSPAAASVLLMAGFPSAITAGAPGSLTVTVQDAYGNTVTSYRASIHFTSSDNRASLPADYTFTAGDNGVHTFSVVLATA